MEPTAQALQNRLTPTPATYPVPSNNGLFTVPGSGMIFYIANGNLYRFDITSVLTSQERNSPGWGNQLAMATSRLKDQYGIDINSLPQQNGADLNSYIQSNGIKEMMPNGNHYEADSVQAIQSMYNSGQKATQQNVTVNTQPNTLSTPPAQPVATTQVSPQTAVLGQTSGAQSNPYASATSYTGNSIVDFLVAAGQPSDINSRTALATKAGITNYTGTAQQNLQLLDSLRKENLTSQGYVPITGGYKQSDYKPGVTTIAGQEYGIPIGSSATASTLVPAQSTGNYVSIPTANGNSYFQNLNGTLTPVSDFNTLKGLTSGTITSTQQAGLGNATVTPPSVTVGGRTYDNADIVKLVNNPSLGTSNNYSYDASGNIVQAPTKTFPNGTIMIPAKLLAPTPPTQQANVNAPTLSTGNVNAPNLGGNVTAPTISATTPTVPTTGQITAPNTQVPVPNAPGQVATPQAPAVATSVQAPSAQPQLQAPNTAIQTPTIPGQSSIQAPSLSPNTVQTPQLQTPVSAPNTNLGTPVTPNLTSQQVQAPNLNQNISAPNLGTQTPEAPTQDFFNQLSGPQFVTQPINQQLLAQYGLTPPTNTQNPIQAFGDTYKQLLNTLGVADIKTQFESVQKKYSDLENELNDKIGGVNDDPWLTEGVRVGRIRSLQDKYQGKLGILNDQMTLYNSLYQQGIQEAQYVTNAAYNQSNFNTQTQLNILQLAEQQLAAQNSLSQQSFANQLDVAQLKQGQSQQGFENQLTNQNFLLDRANQQYQNQLAAAQFNTGLTQQNFQNQLSSADFNSGQAQQNYQNQVTNLQLKQAQLQQGFDNSLSAGQYNSSQAQQIFDNQMAVQNYNNAIKQQQFSNQLASMDFNSQQGQQAFANQVTSIQLNQNQLQQKFENQLKAGSYNADLAQQLFDNQMQVQTFNEAAKQQGFSNQLQTQQFTANQQQQWFENQLTTMEAKQVQLQNQFDNQIKAGTFNKDTAQQLFDNQMGINQFKTAIEQQNFQNTLAAQQANQNTAQQGFENNLALQQFLQATQNQNFSNQLNASQFNSQQSQQGFANQMASTQFNADQNQQQFNNQVAAGQLANQTLAANKPDTFTVGSNIYKSDPVTGAVTLVGSAPIPAGTTGTTGTPTSTVGAKTVDPKNANLVNYLQQYSAFLGSNSAVGTALSPEAQAKRQSLISLITAEYKQAKGLGTLDAGVQKLIDGLLGNSGLSTFSYGAQKNAVDDLILNFGGTPTQSSQPVSLSSLPPLNQTYISVDALLKAHPEYQSYVIGQAVAGKDEKTILQELSK